MPKVRVNPHAQGQVEDAAETWLRQNDPFYASKKRGWVAPTTDALSRVLSDTGPHSTLADLRSLGGGNYGRSGQVAGDGE
jgi:hypothetical protein